MTYRLFTICLTLSLMTGLTAIGQTQQPEQRLAIGISEVVVDVVVRDKKGQPVKGLTATDFELTEDGVPQQITSSRMVTVEASATTSSTATAPTTTTGNVTGSLEAPRVTAVAMIFDRLSPEDKTRARDAALSFVGDNMKLDALGCVYSIDLSMKVLQPLTQDAQLVKTAIERAAEEATTIYQPQLGEMSAVRRELTTIYIRDATNPTGPPAGDPFRRASLESQLRFLESFEALQQEQLGQATINALSAAIESLKGVSGRKAVIFFSDGLLLPPSVEPILRAIIGSASRAHVSVYTVDAAGLRIASAQRAISNDIQARANARMEQLRSTTDPTGPMTRGLERNETVLRSADPRHGLSQLADQTGGFLISDTNDFKAGMKRIDEDLRTYYLLTYAPKAQTVDGRFRKIEVKVKRGGLAVQNRTGYFAINASFASPVMEYETPALAIAASGHQRHDFKIGASALSFPEPSRTGLVAALAQLPMRLVTFQTDEKSKTFATDFSVVMLFKSDKDEVIKKLSHHYVLSGPFDSLEAARKDTVLFFRQTDLYPGRYRVETVVYDALGKKSGSREDTVEVPALGDNDLRLSSVVVISRAERLSAAEQKESNPLHVGELLAYPSMGEALSKTTYKNLPFFFTVYVPKGSAEKPSLTIELAQGGQALARMPAELPAPDSFGRIQYAGGIPLEKIPAGEYELRVTVKAGASSVTNSAHVAVE